MMTSSWTSLAAFIDMGGYGLYVWGSMGMCAAVVGAEVMLLRVKRRLLAREVLAAPPPAASIRKPTVKEHAA